MNAGKSWSNCKTYLFNTFCSSLSIYPEGVFKKSPDLAFIKKLRIKKITLYHYKKVVEYNDFVNNHGLLEIEGGGSIPKSKVIPTSPYSIKSISIDDHDNFEKIYTVDTIEKAKIYNYISEDLTKLKGLNKIKYLEINSSKSLYDLQGIEFLESLETLILSGCNNLNNIKDFKESLVKKFIIDDNRIYKRSEMSDEQLEYILRTKGARFIDISWQPLK